MDFIHDIAIFPVPEVVAFPGMVMPLHIFEPRYRKMAEDSQRLGFDVGIALPKKTISKPHLSSDFTQHNAASYEPHDILSAGALKILKKLQDGRFLVRVEFRYRCEIIETVQTLPYMRARVHELEDLPVDPESAQDMIMQILDAASHLLDKPIHVDKANLGVEQVNRTLQTIFNWTLGWLPTDSELAQKMLEFDSMPDRVSILLTRMGRAEPVKEQPKPKYHQEGKIIYVDFHQLDNTRPLK